MPNPLYGSLSLPWVGSWSTYPLTQTYGASTNPQEPAGHGYAHWHTGLDFGMPNGTAMLAMADGTVQYAGHDTTGYGLKMVIQYTNGLWSLYGHQSSTVANTGDSVKRGQVVSYSGGGTGNSFNDGNSTGAHLHMSVQTGMWADIDPRPYIAGAPVTSIAPGSGVQGAGGTATGPGLSQNVPLPPNLIISADSPLDPSLGLDPNPLKARLFTDRARQLASSPGKMAAAMIEIDGRYLPVISLEAALSAYRAPGSFRAEVSLDWLRRTSAPNDRHTLETLLSRGPTQVNIYAGFVDDVLHFRPDDLVPLFAGLTDPPRMVFEPAGNILTIAGPDLSGLFNQPGTTAPSLDLFANRTSSDVAALLAARHNIYAEVSPTTDAVSTYYGSTAIKQRTQGQTEWDVLTQLAGVEGFVCYLSGSTLQFRPPLDLTRLPAAYPLNAGPADGVGSPIMRVSLEPQPHSKREYYVQVQSYDTKTKVTASGIAQRDGAALDAATSGNPDSVNVITVNMASNTPQKVLQKRANDLLSLYQATEVLLIAEVEGVLPIDRERPILLHGSNIIPDLNDGQMYFPAHIVYHYDASRGLWQDITFTSRPLGVITTDQASNLTGGY